MNVWCARWPPLAGFIYARAVDELGPCGLLGPLEDGASAMLALDVARSFDEPIFALLSFLRLICEQFLNELGSCGLLGNLVVWILMLRLSRRKVAVLHMAPPASARLWQPL